MARDTAVRGGRLDRTETRGARRPGTRALLGWAAVLLGVLPVLVLWSLVQVSWAPLAELDHGVATALNEVVSGSPGLGSASRVVTDLGSAWLATALLSLATVVLLVRRRWRTAAFVATAGVGMAVLGPAVKALVDRARPVVAAPVVETPSNASFPSGHALTAVVLWGVLLLVVLPAVRPRARPWLVAAAAVVAVAVGFTRLTLGVHYLTDVLAGWALGAGWLAVTVAAFRAWPHDRTRPGAAPDTSLDLHTAPPGPGHAAAPVSPDRGAALVLAVVAIAALAWIVGRLLRAAGRRRVRTTAGHTDDGSG